MDQCSYEDPIGDVEIGLELDFADNSFKEAKKIGSNLTKINEVFQAFIKQIEKNSKDVQFDPPLADQLKKDGFKSSNIEAVLNTPKKALFSYQIRNIKSFNAQHITVFVTLDYNVIEIIIEKTPFKNLKLFEQKIQKYVYGFAEAAGLSCTQDLECMTHINVDYVSGFRSQLGLAFKMFSKANTLCEIEESHNRVVLANAPTLQEIRFNQQDLEKIESFEKFEDVNALVNELILFFKNNKRYNNFIKQFSDQTKDKISQDPLHYQAVNLQHLADPSQETQRVEFRRYWSQKNFDLTLGQVENLCRHILWLYETENTPE